MIQNFRTQLILKSIAIIFLFLGSLECFLRVGGWATLFIQKAQNEIKLKSENEYRVMCVGESLTYDGGENSYPEQLERLLNENNPSPPFKVINKGVPGQRSGHIVKYMGEWLDEFHPRMVVVMMGMNDFYAWKAVDQKSRSAQFTPFWEDLRIFKLTRGLQKKIKENLHPSSHSALTLVPQFKTAEPGLSPWREPAAQPPAAADNINTPKMENYKLYLMLRTALIYSEKDQFPQAEKLLKQFVEENYEETFTNRSYMELGRIYKRQERYKPFIEVLRYFLKKNILDVYSQNEVLDLCKKPDRTPYALSLLYELKEKYPQKEPVLTMLSNCYESQGDLKQASYFAQKARDLRLAGVNPSLKKYYLELAGILKKRHVKGVFVQYPLLDIASLKNMFVESKNAEDIIFVDNERSFREAITKGKYEDYFKDKAGGLFGHATTEGYHLLAQNVADSILGDVKKKSSLKF